MDGGSLPTLPGLRCSMTFFAARKARAASGSAWRLPSAETLAIEGLGPGDDRRVCRRGGGGGARVGGGKGVSSV